MTYRRSGKLHQTMPVDGVFILSAPGVATWTDDTITELNVTRGGTGDGLTPSTMSATVLGDVPPAGDQALNLTLSNAAAAWIGNRTGRPAEELKPRWFGRIGGQEVNDEGDARADRWTTDIDASHWLAQLTLIDDNPVLDNSNTSVVGSGVNVAVSHMLRMAALPMNGNPLITRPNPSGTGWDTVFEGTRDTETGPQYVTFKDVLSTFTADVGTMLRTRRNGALELIHIHARKAAAAAWKQTAPMPLHRSQCLRPVSWRQPITSPASVPYRWRDDSSGTTWSSEVTVYSSTTSRPIRSEVLDFTKLINRTGFPNTVSTARANDTAGLGYRVESVTVDLLALLRSPNPGDWQQAGQLLTLEHGDPIVLSYDWPTVVAGCYFAQQITERITKNEWRMTLALAPVRTVVGGTGPADISGPTWDTRHPASTTWDTVPATDWDHA